MSEKNFSGGQLILFPTPISTLDAASYLSPIAIEKARGVKIFFFEKPKIARAIISKLSLAENIESLYIIEIGKNSLEEEIENQLLKIAQGENGVLMSDAGMPCIGDPGWEVVKKAHAFGIQVVPMPGPSSFLEALMASGFSGQQFSFHGYLPIDKAARKTKLKEISANLRVSGYSQIFMETPYRNKDLFNSVLTECDPSFGLCLAIDLNGPDEEIITTKINEWKKMKFEFPKSPSVFILGLF